MINIALFIILLLVINFLAYLLIAEPLLYKGYFIPKNVMKKYNSFLLGDSHAKAIRQTDLDQLHIFNLGYDTDSYFDSALKLNYLIRNKFADTVYVCVDNHTLSHYRESWTNRDRSLYYANYNEYIKYYKTSPIKFWLEKNIYIYLPLLKTENSKVFKKYLYSIFKGNKPKNYENFDISTSSEEDLIQRSIDRVNTQFPDETQSENLMHTLKEMLDLCDENNIVVYGIKFPLTREYLNVMGNKSYKADSLFLKEKHKVYDFSYLFPDSTHYFRDQDHVNYTGSKEFVNHILNSGL